MEIKWKQPIPLQTQPVAAPAKSLQLCPSLCDPIDGSSPGSPSLGFSRQEHWSGLPFLSPMHESEKWKWNCAVVYDPQWPHVLQPSRVLRPWDFPGKSTQVGAIAFSKSQPKQNLKPKPNRGNCLLNHMPTFWKSFSFLLPESSLVY